jgi:hypothetical protein
MSAVATFVAIGTSWTLQTRSTVVRREGDGVSLPAIVSDDREQLDRADLARRPTRGRARRTWIETTGDPHSETGTPPPEAGHP